MISTIISSFGISDIFSLSIIFIVIYVTQFYYRYFTRPNPLPGPFPLPILGNVHQKGRLQYNEWLISMHEKYGDLYEMYLGGERLIIACRADLIDNMVVPSTKTKYPNRIRITEGFIEIGANGVGIINNNNPSSWKYNRQFFTQAMINSGFNHQAIEWTIELWEQMETYWNNLGENQELDLTKWVRRFTNDMIFKVSTGVTNNSVTSYYNSLILENNNSLLNEKERESAEESEHFIQAMDTYMNGIMYFFVFNKFVRHYVPFIRGKVINLLKNRDYLHGKIHNIIKQRRIEIENTPLDQPLRHDMLTSNITANTPRDINTAKHVDADLLRPMTDDEIFGNMFDAMIAGTDTTANLFCFIVYHLGHYPEVKNRLIQEFETVLGKDLTKPITPKDLDELKYCDAVIKEVYRHYPVVYTMGRESIESDKVGGYDWPEGTLYQMQFSSILKHKESWTEPEKFDPDRFYKVEESDKYLLEKQRPKNSFPMWGGGIRICPGRKLAMIELKCLLASIYRKYDIELADMSAPLKYTSSSLTLSEELFVRIKPRKF